MPLTTDTTSDSDSADDRRDMDQNLSWLRNTLRTRVTHLRDEDLKHRTVTWIQRSLSLPAGDVADYIEAELADLESEFKMHDHDGVDAAEDAFPDDCEGCPHYGGGCPVVTQRVPSDELDRLASEAETELAFKRGVRQLANLHECHLLPQWITEWETRHKGLIKEGWELYSEIEVDVTEMDSPGAKPKIDPRADEDDENGGGY